MRKLANGNTMKNRITFLFILIFCFSILGNSTKSEPSPEEAHEWIEKSRELTYTNPEQAVYYASRAINLLTEEGANDRKAEALFAYALAERLLGNFDSSIKTLSDALEIVSSTNSALRGHILSLMGVVYSSLTDYNKAIELNEKATSIFKSINDSASIALCYNNRGIIHYSLNEFSIAEQFLMQALTINRSLKLLKGIASNLNNLCLYEGNHEEKIALINEAIVINRNLNSKWSLGENYNNLGKQYYYAGRYSDALQALRRANNYASEVGAKELICDNFEYSSWVFAALGDFKNAYESVTQLHVLNKELQSSNKLRTLEIEISNKRLQEQKRVAELQERNYKIELLKRNIFMLLVIMIMMIVSASFLSKWYKRKKHIQLMETQYKLEQTEREVAEQRVRQQELELTSIQTVLANKRREVTSFAVYLNTRNTMLDKIKEMIKEGYKLGETELIQHLKKINVYISQFQSVDQSDGLLLSSIQDKDQEYLQSLTELHPQLTPGERQLAALLRVGLSTKEISVITGSTPKTINMNRYRLRKALLLSSEESLTEYLQSIR